MLEMLIHVCILFQGLETDCHVIKKTFLENIVTTQSCYMNGQLEAAQLLERNPNYVFKKIECGYVDQQSARL